MTRSRREILILNYTLSISTYHGERQTRPWAGRPGRIMLPGDIRSRARASAGSARTQAHRHRHLSALHDPSRFQILVAFRRCRSHTPMENHRAFAESLSPITWRFAPLKADSSRRGVIQCARGLSRTRTQQPSFQGSVYTAGVPQVVWLPSLGSCGCKLLAAHFLGG